MGATVSLYQSHLYVMSDDGNVDIHRVTVT